MPAWILYPLGALAAALAGAAAATGSLPCALGASVCLAAFLGLSGRFSGLLR